MDIINEAQSHSANHAEAKPGTGPIKPTASPSVIQRLTAQIAELLLQPDRTLAIQLALGACYLGLKLLCQPKALLSTLERLAAQHDRKTKAAGQSGNTVRNLRNYATLLTKYVRLTFNSPGTKHHVAPRLQLGDLAWLSYLAFGVDNLTKQLAEANLKSAAELIRQVRAQDHIPPNPTLSWHAACSRLRVALLALPLVDRQAALNLISQLINQPSSNPPIPKAELDHAA